MKTTKQFARELGLLRKRKLSSSSLELLKKQKTGQMFSYLIIIDFESTCWENKTNSQEIIEFPAVLLNTQTGCVESEFHYFVQPQEHPTLSIFCCQLTGITQDQVDNGIPLSLCIRKFSHWLHKLCQDKEITLSGSSFEGHSENTKHLAAFVTWSGPNPNVTCWQILAVCILSVNLVYSQSQDMQDMRGVKVAYQHYCFHSYFTYWDMGVCLHYELRRKQITKPAYFNRWIDLRATYTKFYERKPKGLNGALQAVGIEFEGREHSGLHDSRNTAKLAWRMIQDGCLMKITKKLSGAHCGIGSNLFQEKRNECISPVKKRSPLKGTRIGEQSKACVLHKTRTVVCCQDPEVDKRYTQFVDGHKENHLDHSFSIQKQFPQTRLKARNGAPQPLRSALGSLEKDELPQTCSTPDKIFDLGPLILGKTSQKLSSVNSFIRIKSGICFSHKADKNPLDEHTKFEEDKQDKCSMQDRNYRPLASVTTSHIKPVSEPEPQGIASTCSATPSNHILHTKLLKVCSTLTEPSKMVRRNLQTHSVGSYESDSRQHKLAFLSTNYTYSKNQNCHHLCSSSVAIPNTIESNYLIKTPSPPFQIRHFNEEHFTTPMQFHDKNVTKMKYTPPLCLCGRRTKRRLVQNPGPNMGRWFFSCNKGTCAVNNADNKKGGCNFFQWEFSCSTFKQGGK